MMLSTLPGGAQGSAKGSGSSPPDGVKGHIRQRPLSTGLYLSASLLRSRLFSHFQ